MYFDLHNNPKRWYYPHFPVEETDSESQATSQGHKAIVNSRARTRTKLLAATLSTPYMFQII